MLGTFLYFQDTNLDHFGKDKKDDDEIVQSYRVDYQTAEAILPALEINLAIVEAFSPKRIHIPESDYERGLLHDLNLTPSLSGEFTKEVIAENGFKTLVDVNDVYNWEERPEELNIKTFYEKMWLEEGKKIKYLKFQV